MITPVARLFFEAEKQREIPRFLRTNSEIKVKALLCVVFFKKSCSNAREKDWMIKALSGGFMNPINSTNKADIEILFKKFCFKKIVRFLASKNSLATGVTAADASRNFSGLGFKVFLFG